MPNFVPAVEPPTAIAPGARWFAFQGDRLLVRFAGPHIDVPLVVDPDDLGVTTVLRNYLGSLGDQPCYAAEIADDASAPPGMSLEGLRSLFGRLDDDLFAVAGRAIQIVTWDRTHQFCGQCGTSTQRILGERARQCPSCGLTAYPRISPAVIVRITRGDEILLARGRNFPEGRYSTPAGFVEPGETLEETVAREIREEVGVKVDNIEYFGSQPWPYPHQMMIGFTCRWVSGEIAIDPNEIADARWFTRETMPQIPPPMSISRRLIDSFMNPDHASGRH
jgi:NAD+ diphosphatase